MSVAHIIGRIKNKGIINTVLYLTINPLHRIIVVLLDKLIFRNERIDEKMILFFSTPDFSDNAKYLYEYYLENKDYKDYRFVWLMESKIRTNNGQTTFVKARSKWLNHFSIKAYYYLSKASIIYYTHIPSLPITKKKEQLVINLWHGCGFKDRDAIDKKRKNYWIFDYAIVPGNIFVQSKSVFWDCPKDKILPLGYPRYDLFKKKKAFSSIYKNTLGKKIIIWMPTLRAGHSMFLPESDIRKQYDLPAISTDTELKELDQYCEEMKCLLIIKRHPLQKKYLAEKNKFKNIYFASNEDFLTKGIELYQLLPGTDGLITDYSSIAFDYLLLNKPIAYVMDDFEAYAQKRGFIFKKPEKYMPGPKIKNLEDLKDFINNITEGKDLYVKERAEVLKVAQNPTSNYCERLSKEIKERLEK